jgi:signal peptidase II
MGYLSLIVVIGLVGIDQLIKYWALHSLSINGDIYIWPNVFHLAYVENRGAAFGILQNQRVFLVIIPCLVLVGIIWYWRQIPENKWGFLSKWALILIISGAIGNLIDRLYLGFVVDYLYVALIDFPVFNFADICVVVGVALLIPALFLGDLTNEKQKKDDENDKRDRMACD